MVRWKAEVAQLAATGRSGLQAFRAKVQQDAASPGVADTLDIVFGVTGLGQQLIGYCNKVCTVVDAH